MVDCRLFSTILSIILVLFIISPQCLLYFAVTLHLHSELYCTSLYFTLPNCTVVYHIGLIQVKEEIWMGFSKEQPCQPEENPVHPNTFSKIYILFKIGHFGVFILNFSNIFFRRSLIVA